ncbi:MAG: CoA-binding protein [Desulfatiglandales bacterium]
MNLAPLFVPYRVAVIGASDEPTKLGFHVMKSLKYGRFEGLIFPVNPNREEVMGIKCYRGLREIQMPIDLAIVVVPNRSVEGVFKECLSKGVKGIVLISAGFKESEGGEGAILQERLRELVLDSVPVIGPNTFGIVSYPHRLNASFTPEFSLVRPGNVALVSQSGGISHLMGFMALEMDLGLSCVVGLGNRLNVDFHHMVEYLRGDQNTSIIGLYVEGIESPKLLMEAIARAQVPVVVMKAGKGEIADKASLSHTGSLAGSYEAFKGGMTQAGALVLEEIEEFMDILKAYQVLRPPSGPRIAILSGQAGPGIVAYDTSIQRGLLVEPFKDETLRRVEEILPPLAIRSNPVDLGPLWYDEGATTEVVRRIMEDNRIDAIIFLMMFASANREVIPALIRGLKDLPLHKPIFTCIKAPGAIWQEAVKEAEEGGILCNFPTPERATKACYNMLILERLRFRKKGGRFGAHR